MRRGVAEPTVYAVYAVYGSKARLALALIDAVEADADPARTSADLVRPVTPPASSRPWSHRTGDCSSEPVT